MAITNISPNSVEFAGSWSLPNSSILDILSDGTDEGAFSNSSGNQALIVGLEDVGINFTFTSFTSTIHARKGPKSNGSVNIRVTTNAGDTLSSHDITVNTEGVSVYTTPSTSLSFNTSVANGLLLHILGLDDTQCFYSEAFVTLTGTSTSGLIQLNSGLVQLTDGKVIL